MRVVHVLGELNPSGAETMLRVAADGFVAKGLTLNIISTGVQLGEYAPALVEAGYKLYHVPFNRSLLFFWQLYRLLRVGQYEVVHLHTERANFWIGLIALVARPRRIIRTVHNCFEFKGKLRWIRGLQRRLLNRLGVVHVSIGASVRDNEAETFGLATRLVSNWYDDQKFGPISKTEREQARQALDVSESENIIVTVGNCSKIKNHTSLLRAIAMLPVTERPLYIHIGKEDSEQSERALANELGIAGCVRFFGPIVDIRPLLQAADVYVMPSLNEGFSIAAIEALAMGLTIIFADVAGLKDFKDVYPNLHYADPDPLSIKNALQKVMAESKSVLSEQASSYPMLTKQRYGVRRGIEGYYNLYTAKKLADF